MKFKDLLPDIIFETASCQGYQPTGALFPLSSYENRVYEIGVEEGEPIIAKYYRTGRWSVGAIADEHHFIEALAEAEIPVVSPLVLKKPISALSTLAQYQDLYYSFYPKFRGRERAEYTLDDLRWLGRSLGRLHNIGETFRAKHRLHLNPQTFGYDSLEFILNHNDVPDELKSKLELHLEQALELCEPYFTPQLKIITVHGDCHPGNILWNQVGPYLLDFDDMVIAPPVQDIWMLFNGTADEKQKQREAFFEGYEIFREFDYSTLKLTEALRTLRMIRHAAWIGQRYEESAFKIAFPYYKERRYWEAYLQEIREQIALLQEATWG